MWAWMMLLGAGQAQNANRYFTGTQESLFQKAIDEKSKLAPICDVLSEDPVNTAETYELLLDSVGVDWLGDSVRHAAHAGQLLSFSIYQILISLQGMVGITFFILMILIFGLCCWQWWRCCKCCRVKPPEPNQRKNIVLIAFMLISVLGVFLAGVIGFGGFASITSGVDGLFCESTDFVFETFDMVKSQMGHLSDLYYGLAADSQTLKDLDASLSQTAGIEAAQNQFDSVLEAYETGLLAIKNKVNGKKFECFTCTAAAGAISELRSAFSSGAFTALIAAKDQVKESFKQNAVKVQVQVDDAGKQLEKFAKNLEPMKDLLDVNEGRDTIIMLIAAVCALVFVLALLLILCSCCTVGCCANLDRKNELKEKNRRVRCCASLGMCYSFLLMWLVFILAFVMQFLTFVLGGPCIFLWEMDGIGLGNFIGVVDTEAPGGYAGSQQEFDIWNADFLLRQETYDECDDKRRSGDKTLLECQALRFGRPVDAPGPHIVNIDDDVASVDAVDGRRMLAQQEDGKQAINELLKAIPNIFQRLDTMNKLGVMSNEKVETAKEKLRRLQKELSANDLFRDIFDTCIQDPNGRLMQAIKMYACPYGEDFCTEDEKTLRTMEELFIDDILKRIDDTFDALSSRTYDGLSGSTLEKQIVDFMKRDPMEWTITSVEFWADPRWTMLLKDERGSLGFGGGKLYGTTADTALGLRCGTGAEIDGKTSLGFTWFLAKLDTLVWGDFTGEAAGAAKTANREASVADGLLCSTTLPQKTCPDATAAGSAARAALMLVTCRAQALIANTAGQLSDAAYTQFTTWANAANYVELFGPNADAEGRMQCDPCRAGNNLLRYVNDNLWAGYPCPTWKNSKNVACDVKDLTFTGSIVNEATDCASVGLDGFKSAFVQTDDLCDASSTGIYMTEYEARIKTSTLRIDNGFKYFSTMVSSGLRNSVNDLFGKTLLAVRDSSSCGFLGNLYYGLIDGICWRAVPGILALSNSYMALGILCLLLTISCWVAWLAALHYGLYMEQADRHLGIDDMVGAPVGADIVQDSGMKH